MPQAGTSRYERRTVTFTRQEVLKALGIDPLDFITAGISYHDGSLTFLALVTPESDARDTTTGGEQ